MALALSSMVMTASATSETGVVNGVTVNYSTTISATSSLSTSSFQEDPTKHDFELQLYIAYQYKNQRTGDISANELLTPRTSGGGIGRQVTAPTGCTMLSAEADHYCWVDGVRKVFYSYAVR